MKIGFPKKNQAGFTLIELIASLVIFALMFTIAGMAIVMAARGYMITKESAHMAQKAQLAMTRMNRELMEITDIIAKDDAQSYIIYDLVGERNALAKDGTAIRLFSDIGSQTTLPDMSNGDILVDDVSSFSLTTNKGGGSWVLGTDNIGDLSTVQIDLVMSRTDSGVGDKTFTTTVRPRNTKTQ
jgi:prepilin-type N-terminal cleavage/methylation domain-containing protein